MKKATKQSEASSSVSPVTPLDPTIMGSVADDLRKSMSREVIGQEQAIDEIVEAYQFWKMGLNDPTRPVASFLFLGPTGVGKTRTIEVLAKALHGSHSAFLKIDCGEYQMEHEVAKLIGAPPGYLGHRETQPALTQQKLTSVASEKCGLSIVLFDEIEKAAPSMTRILLGALDRGSIRLGDNTQVNFSNSLIFFTSNLGVKDIINTLNPNLGFSPGDLSSDALTAKLSRVVDHAVEKKFPIEFVNRIDRRVVFNPLSHEDLLKVLDLEIAGIQDRLNKSKVPVEILVGDDAREWLVRREYKSRFGARQTKRVLNRDLVIPVANLIASKSLIKADTVLVSCNQDGLQFIKENVVVNKAVE